MEVTRSSIEDRRKAFLYMYINCSKLGECGSCVDAGWVNKKVAGWPLFVSLIV